MPSKLQQASAQQALGTYARAKQTSSALAKQATRFQAVEIRGPFVGFAPDVDPNLIDGTAFTEMENVLARAYPNHGEVLGLPDGYRQVEKDPLNPDLPLGAPDPVVMLGQFVRFAPTSHPTDPGEFTGEFIATAVAATSGDGVTPETSKLYRISSTGAWVEVAPSASVDASGLLAGRDGRASSKSMPDWCVAPFGAVARADNETGDPANDQQSGPILEPAFIYTNDVDEVTVFPSATSLTLAATHAYEPLCDETSSIDLDPFKAKSVETWNGRVYFLNTSEAGTRYSQRLRRTAKFTCDPLTSNPGAGFYDFREYQGEGLRIETLGDILAVYFTDAVAFVQPTGNPTSPDFPQTITTSRGLMGTHAMCSVERNRHFGVFTDGWWFLDQSGRWQEAGLINLKSSLTPKWRQTFYDNLTPTSRHRIYCFYDQPANLIYIATPTLDDPEPEQVWIYDPVSDRVFFENYPVTCFGSFAPLTQSALIINAAAGTIDSFPGTIDSYGATVGFPQNRIHGDSSGYVYSHSRLESGYHAAVPQPAVQEPEWSFSMGLRSVGGMKTLNTVDRVSIEYFNHQNPGNVSVEVRGSDTDGTATEQVQFTEGTHEDLHTADAWFRFSSVNPGLAVHGAGEYHIRGLKVDLFTDESEPRRG